MAIQQKGGWDEIGEPIDAGPFPRDSVREGETGKKAGEHRRPFQVEEHGQGGKTRKRGGWAYRTRQGTGQREGEHADREEALVLNRIAQLIAGDGAVAIDYKGVQISGIDEAAGKAIQRGGIEP